MSAQLAPAALKASEYFSGPIHLNDIQIDYDEGRLALTVWKRAAGLRLAPMILVIDEVDNAEAAEAFVAEVSRRQKNAEKPGKLAGPLDYWVGWIGLLLVILTLIRWPMREQTA